MLKYGLYFSLKHFRGDSSMNFLKRPIGVTVTILAVVILAQLTKFSEAALQMGLVYAFLIVAILLHELGHVVFGKFVGYQFHYVTFGPFTIEPRGILWNERWAAFGGLTRSTPKTTDVKILAKKHRWYVLGGPVFSYLGMFLAYICAFLFDNDSLNILALLNLALLIVTALPLNAPLRTDGRVFLELKKGGEQAEQFVSSVLLQKWMMSEEQQQNWPVELIEKSKEIPASTGESD